jgi:hypothetical protein
VHSPSPNSAQVQDAPGPPRWLRWLGWIFLIVVVVVAALAAIGYFEGYRFAKAWVESPAGQRAASQGLGKAIKVDGAFQPLHLHGLQRPVQK